ncbi:MAG TPA: phosphatase PAP2 family protein [Stellaceae bacterium]|nr:phosphatase PAP2 family protein [Stellaceae bacterium]
MTQIQALFVRPAKPASLWLRSGIACFVLIVVCYYAVDRPIAALAHEYTRGIVYFTWLTYIANPLPPLACLALIAMAAWRAAGIRRNRTGSVVLRCSLSLVSAVAIKDQLKFVFGRAWPEPWLGNNPSFFGDGLYGFVPFHGGRAFASFPSGHATAIFAVMVVLWVMWPAYRWLYALVIALVVIGLLGADFHWVSDIVAGAFLGTAAGVTAATIGTRGALSRR